MKIQSSHWHPDGARSVQPPQRHELNCDLLVAIDGNKAIRERFESRLGVAVLGGQVVIDALSGRRGASGSARAVRQTRVELLPGVVANLDETEG
ncbi:MAG: hypothetical protein ACKODX_09170 [Gemmata sp.]